MLTERKQPLAMGILCVPAICLMFFVVGCGPDSPDSTASSSPPPATNVRPLGVVLRADPNPVPSGPEAGKTTIIWDTGSESVADIYSVDGTAETLFATGAKGSKEFTSIRPGSNEFRLYNQGQHKLVTKVIVTMPGSAASTSSASATPAATASQ